jgi:DNA-binding protein HU-beta
MSLSRAGLIDYVQKALGPEVTKAVAEQAIVAVINSIKLGVKEHKSLQLMGFGTFNVTTRPARKGVHPKTQKVISIPTSTSVKFIPGTDFRKSLAPPPTLPAKQKPRRK